MDPIETALAELPRHYPGPGGAAALVRDGEVVARHAWGYANAERRIPFTSRSLFRMCSVTKQFTCAAMLDSLGDPAGLEPALHARLPLLPDPPGALHMAHNQSGLRDYWAVAMLHGAPAESPFGDVDAAFVIGTTRSLQFAPGTRYSYANNNFRLIGDALQDVTGRSFADLLARVFDRAGMGTALLGADTRALPDGTEGYEGSQASGFRPAVNRVLWTGDAGLVGSLDDMIAWEQHIDATRDDPESLYARLSRPVTFAGGAPAAYGFGLGRRDLFGRASTGHGGALRGWRSHRLHVAAERLSVVVLFNHLSDAQGAAIRLLAAALGAEWPAPESEAPAPPWLGAFRDPATGLSARLEAGPPGQIRLRYGHTPELLDLQADGAANPSVSVRPEGAGLRMVRPNENASTLLEPLADDPPLRAGRYRCAELDAELIVARPGDVPYATFAGRLGPGRMELLDRIGPGHWALPMPRALDHTPPGDWTLAVTGDAITVGCWLAHGLRYERVG